ncbi:MAG: hypothetical protein KDC80_27060 [Saprospiraceae bacterium]|nr:hypothetical protein [Saprospiraceae bacterium]
MKNQASSDLFAADTAFLRQYIDIRTLESPEGAVVAVSPDLQGRVMTSTAGSNNAHSYGWINRSLFESGDTLPHMNAFGGEERFWLGPEGGQYSIFFKQNDPFDLEHWQTPRLIDLDKFPVRDQNSQKIVFEKEASLTNYSGFTFDFKIERTVEILSSQKIKSNLNLPEISDLPMVGYQTVNRVTNTGTSDWQESNGLLSIWLLGMYNPSESTTIILPYNNGPEEKMGSIVNDDYFGKVPSDRLIVRDNTIFFKGDGKYRSKIGLNPKRAKNICGAYDAENQILTIVRYSKPGDVDKYVNSLWEIQDDPYGGDVINSYNDGPPAPGEAPLGPFFELETSSPALALKSGNSGEHIQETYHFEGDEEKLEKIMQQLLGVTVDEVKSIF